MNSEYPCHKKLEIGNNIARKLGGQPPHHMHKINHTILRKKDNSQRKGSSVRPGDKMMCKQHCVVQPL
jgi:hypothetical protein